jgi:DNA-directed RNA polymerase specialized sigma24 family protein
MNSVKTQSRISGATASREEFFRELYEKAFYPVASFVRKNGGSFEQAKDIFHDSLIILYEKEFYQGKSIDSPKAYVVGIAKHLWNKQVNLAKTTVDIEGTELPFTAYDAIVNEAKLLSWIERTSQKCLDILQAFYYEKKNTKQIAMELGYRSTHSTTVQKYKCLESLRKEVKQKSMMYEDFTE